MGDQMQLGVDVKGQGSSQETLLVVLMGVTGVGKTTVGKLLADQCEMTFYDADDYHPLANVEKMRAGIPLQDEDRWPWLDRLNGLLRMAQQRGDGVVLACSALKQSYRNRLTEGCRNVRFVLLSGNKALLQNRLAGRQGHYMNPVLLDSQFATLEPPSDALVIDIAQPPEHLAERIRIDLNC
jgi:gluconokinase